MRRAAALLVLLGVAGCGGGSVVTPPAGPPATELRVGMIDYRFQLSAATLTPGTVTVVATNAGSTEHDVVLTEGDTEIGHSDVLAPGGQQTFSVRVTPGLPVHLSCSVAGHDAVGMHAEVAVATR
jgi:uncharacterized cupredoxin-like copper-binding protein